MANATNEADLNNSSTLRSASFYIFLAVTCLLVIQALVLSFATMRALGKQQSTIPALLVLILYHREDGTYKPAAGLLP